MKQQYKRFSNVFKIAFTTPNLPPHILEFQNNPFIRILRFLGGISFLLFLGNIRGYFVLPKYFLILLFMFCLLFFFYHIYISYQRQKYLRKLLKTLEIRNSPLDRFATQLLRVLCGVKGVCDTVASPLGLGVGLMIGADHFLVEGGKEAFFGPLIGGGLNKVLPKSDLDRWRDAYKEATTN